MQDKHFDYEIFMYEKILSGEVKNFNAYFFSTAYKQKRLVTLVRYLIEKKLKISPQEAIEKLSKRVFEQYKLTSVLKYIERPPELEKSDFSYVVYYAYPDIPHASQEELTIELYKKILNNTKKSFPKNYFYDGDKGEERAKYCIKYLQETILKINIKEFYRILDPDLLKKYKLKILLNVLYLDTNDLLNSVYGKEFKKIKEE